jgi:hypothetical protein
VGILNEKTIHDYIEQGFQGDPYSFNDIPKHFLGAVQGYRGLKA